MPALSPASMLSGLHDRGSVVDFASSAASDTSANALQVVCAWPLSGQYGPGSRVLYYVLIAACVFARKADWLKKPCLAAALIVPAVAALHGIVLATLHRDDAVDMDVYGAFQLCSIGIVAAPVTVALSRTYFEIRGRNTIFIWTTLILAGLLSLTIEFYRIQTTGCSADDDGNPISSRASQFPYSKSPMCGMVCDEVRGPHSPMRGGAANNIYVIPAPTRLTFGAATLLAAACCVHALIWLASMSDRVLQSNWIKRFRDNDAEERIHAPIEGTNGATEGKMRNVNDMIRFFLSIAAIPVFGGAGVALLIVGEINLFSHQVQYQTEPIASIGQWAPIVGTGLAVVGSLYLLLAADVEEVQNETKLYATSTHHCNCSHHHDLHGDRQGLTPIRSSLALTRSSVDAGRGHSMEDIAVEDSPSLRATRMATMRTITNVDTGVETTRTITDAGARRRVAETFISIGNFLGTATKNWLDDTEFKRGKALDFPEIPGEEARNRELQRIRETYNQPRDDEGNVTPVPNESRSRATSFIGSVHSGNGDDDARSRRARSPRLSQSPSSSPRLPRRSHSNSLPPVRMNTEPHPLTATMSYGSGSPGLRPPQRSATLEVPSPVHYGHGRYSSPSSPSTPTSAAKGKAPVHSSPHVMTTAEAGPSSARQPKIPDTPSPDPT